MGKAKTEAADEYPQELCEEVAKLVVSVWKRILSLEFWRHQMKVRGDEVSELQKKWTINEMARVKRSTEDDPRGKRARDNNIAEALKADKVEENVIPSANKEMSNKDIRERQNENAVGGMRNPDVSVQRMFLLRSMGEKIRKAWDEFARAKPDVIDAGEDYGSAEAKLQEKLVTAWDDEVRSLLNLRPRSKLVLKGQGRVREPLGTAKGSRDPDIHLANFMETGAPLGMEAAIPPSGVFPKASSAEAKILDDATEFEELRNTVNYKSIAEQREDAAIEIERYIKKGYAVRKTWDWVQKEFGSGTCSRMALIVKSKPDGSTKRRVVIDLKRSSGNDRASVPERIILPRIQDVVRAMRDLWRQSPQLEEHPYRSYGPDIGGEILDIEFVSIDFRDAFCDFANDRREWKHCITPDEKDAQALMWVAMTFGYKGAPLIMARLSSAVGRLIQSTWMIC